MPTFTDNGNRPTACLLSEADGRRSRDNITIVAGSGIIAPNTVLARDEETGGYRAAGADDEASAIALYGADATATAQIIAGLTRDAEVNGKTLIYAPSVTTAAHRVAKHQQLATAGIIVR